MRETVEAAVTALQHAEPFDFLVIGTSFSLSAVVLCCAAVRGLVGVLARARRATDVRCPDLCDEGNARPSRWW
jgi:hypothetical protein